MPNDISAPEATAPATARYTRKREEIVAAATAVLNRLGVKGMTLQEVAKQVGLNTTSVTYYFRRKEDLAAACFLDAIARIRDLLAEAKKEATPRARVERFVSLFVTHHARVRSGEEAPLATFSDLRTLEEPQRTTVFDAFAEMVRDTRRLLEPSTLERRALNARAYVLLDQLFWAALWLLRYDVVDYPRGGQRMLDILVGGIVTPKIAWPPRLIPYTASDSSRDQFLTASTRLINQRGYRGASVEKISAELNVTKGSFYHHNEAKDDLVVACFDRTHDVLDQMQRTAMESPGSCGDQFASAFASLVDYQVSDHGPLLRTFAMGAVPEPLRLRVYGRSVQLTERFASMISDGTADGSLRPVDATIASHMVRIALTMSAPITRAKIDREEVQALIVRPILFGLLTP